MTLNIVPLSWPCGLRLRVTDIKCLEWELSIESVMENFVLLSSSAALFSFLLIFVLCFYLAIVLDSIL